MESSGAVSWEKNYCKKLPRIIKDLEELLKEKMWWKKCFVFKTRQEKGDLS